MTTFEAIWALARQIPFGRVATYGQLARMLGPKNCICLPIFMAETQQAMP